MIRYVFYVHYVLRKPKSVGMKNFFVRVRSGKEQNVDPNKTNFWAGLFPET